MQIHEAETFFSERVKSQHNNKRNDYWNLWEEISYVSFHNWNIIGWSHGYKKDDMYHIKLPWVVWVYIIISVWKMRTLKSYETNNGLFKNILLTAGVELTAPSLSTLNCSCLLWFWDYITPTVHMIIALTTAHIDLSHGKHACLGSTIWPGWYLHEMRIKGLCLFLLVNCITILWFWHYC